MVMAVSAVALGPAAETTSTGMSLEIMSLAVGCVGTIGGFLLGKVVQLVLMFRAVQIMFTVQVYEQPDLEPITENEDEDEDMGIGDLIDDYLQMHWWPPHRIVGGAPRMAWIAAPGQCYYGPQGGGVFTATHVRLKADDKSIIDLPARCVYDLDDDDSMADETNGVDVRSLLIQADNVAELYPKPARNKWRSWMNKENLLTGAFLAILLVSLVLLVSGSGITE